nr:hypothetical protein [Tanacetum cinerariifolium]
MEVLDFATPVIQSTINESLKNVFLAKSSSQPKSTYKAAESLTEFELKKILLDKIDRSESYKTAPEHKELYGGLDKTVSMRNRIKLHIIHDDSLLGTLKFVSKTQDYQQYGALIPDDMINQDIKDSNAYNTYYDFAIGKVPPRKARKYKKVASPSKKLSPVKEAEPVKKAKRVKRPAKKSTTAPTAWVSIRDTPGVSVSKKKAPAKADKSKGIEILSDVALSEVAQLKEATKRSMKDFHISQASGSGDGTDFKSGVLEEQQRKISGNNEDDNDDDSEDDNDDDSKGDDDKADSNDDGNSYANDNERTDSDDDDENPSFT